MYKFFVVISVVLSHVFWGQEFFQENKYNLSYTNPDVYTIKDIKVEGVKFLDPSTIISISGLRIGSEIKIPGDNIQNAVYKIWDQGFVEDIKVEIVETFGKEITLKFLVAERPRLSSFNFKGLRKSEEDEVKGKMKLIKGKIVTEAIKKNAQAVIKKYLFEKGFGNAQVNVSEQKDSLFSNSVIVTFNVQKNKKVKIKSVDFTGNDVFTDQKLRSKFKKTKQKGFFKFYQSHKFNNKLYEEDKQKLLAFYQKNGFRDIEIKSDSIFYYPSKSKKKQKKYAGIAINLSEGKKYYFRNINWTGNNLYSDSVLSRILNIRKGTVYNKEVLDSKLTFNPNGTDVSSLYLDDGYLFFTVDPVETTIENDSVDIEMRIYEGSQVTIDKINIYGNTKTNDHVILREIRTKPGAKFSRADLVLTQRELSQMGYFNPEKIDIQPVPNAAKGTVDINYTVEEKPSDQIQLSGSYGGYYGLVGSLGLVFNNFSLRNINDTKKWDPLPSGDGQRFSVNFQSTGRQYTNYSLSFTEPWLGGKKPNALTVSISRSSQDPSRRGLWATNTYTSTSTNAKLKVLNLSVSLAKRLTDLDWRLTWANGVSYSRYDLANYQIGSYFNEQTNSVDAINNGIFNNFNFTSTLSRNSLDDVTYPKAGSTMSVSLALTPPYSLFKSANQIANESTHDRLKLVEYNKLMVDYSYFTKLIGKLVINTRAHFGLLSGYNKKIGPGVFERFNLGGNGLTGMNSFILGYDLIPLRGYASGFLRPTSTTPSAVAYNKFVAEMRYPVSLNPMATVYVLGFAEGGNSFVTSKDYNPFNLYRSAGVGARIFMPAFGMIGLDYAVPFDQVPGAGDNWKNTTYYNRFIFTIGQQLR